MNSDTRFKQNMAGVEQGYLDYEEFIEEVNMSAFNTVTISKT